MPITVSKKDFKKIVTLDNDPDISWLKQEGFEEMRADYAKGTLEFYGVRARATLMIPFGVDFIPHNVDTPGIWGIAMYGHQIVETDEHIQEMFVEECRTLTEMLTEIGVIVDE